ncbi:MAG: DUF6298 domain-containing protein, partial [Planctomycetota bacterium]
TNGPLQACEDNPRYFADADGKAVLLVGSHVWYNLVDMGPDDPPGPFDYDEYLACMAGYDHNYMRMWAWEMVKWDTQGNASRYRNETTTFHVRPHPWLRTGPGKALDGKPKFDLTRYNPEYFDRLTDRLEKARKRGIYVSVMMFEGWAMQRVEGGWKSHPFHPDNNVNNINGDANGDGKGLEVHELVVDAVTEIQKAYIRKVIDTANRFDNVLWEISNENHGESTQWQYAMIRYIKEYEKTKPTQHPVGMTFQFRGGTNQNLFDSPADWISPNPEGGYRDNPPADTRAKVILTDTDHLWGIGGSQTWVWKSFARGLNPIFMDPYDGAVLGEKLTATYEPIRRSMGYVLKFAQRMDLTKCEPMAKGFCLANPGKQYLAFQPNKGEPIELKLEPGRYRYEWFDPASGKTVSEGRARGKKAETTFKNPIDGEAVLYIYSRRSR